MNIWEIMESRHSVRKYREDPVSPDAAAELTKEIEKINEKTGFHFKMCLEEPEAFHAGSPGYGSFAGCRNYFALVAPKGEDELVGYYGEVLVLLAQKLGLNTCWVALTYDKNKVDVPVQKGEKIHDLIALGYGIDQGVPHRSKPMDKVAEINENTPKWFISGMDAVLLAPTAINQQKFYFRLKEGNKVEAKALLGPCSTTDLGIVKYHFELGAGKENFTWDK